MKYLDLDREEKDIELALKKDALRPAKNAAGLKRALKEAAGATLAKTKNINIRLSEKVLLKLKAKASQEGLPYQTLVSSILHRYTQNTLC